MAARSEPAQPAHIEPPRLREHRLHCPRCEARLMFDGEVCLCVTCGYEFPAGDLDRDVRLALQRPVRRREVMMAVGSAIAFGGIVSRGLAGVTWFGALAGVAVAAVLLIATAIARRTRP